MRTSKARKIHGKPQNTGFWFILSFLIRQCQNDRQMCYSDNGTRKRIRNGWRRNLYSSTVLENREDRNSLWRCEQKFTGILQCHSVTIVSRIAGADVTECNLQYKQACGHTNERQICRARKNIVWNLQHDTLHFIYNHCQNQNWKERHEMVVPNTYRMSQLKATL